MATASAASLATPKNKTGAIWAMKFSKDGQYLAAGGQEKVVRVWKVIGTSEERTAHEKEEDDAGMQNGGVYTQGKGVRLNAPVFRSEPIQEYHGHTADVLDLSWSKVSLASCDNDQLLTCARTIFYYHRRWIRPSVFGM